MWAIWITQAVIMMSVVLSLAELIQMPGLSVLERPGCAAREGKAVFDDLQDKGNAG
jgi:hypothetical protein